MAKDLMAYLVAKKGEDEESESELMPEKKKPDLGAEKIRMLAESVGVEDADALVMLIRAVAKGCMSEGESKTEME